jgi:hypothetical protein
MSQEYFGFYQIKRIFLACPGDLVSERSRFRRLIETVNSLRAHSLGFHLEAVGWERVIPSFGRPQDLINRELRIADLAVILFWNRIGSPSSKDSSKTGTVEEFELARRLFADTKRPLVWVYFRKPTVDSGDQLTGVLSFRKDIEEEKDLFFREYETVEEWEEMFREHLVAYLGGLQRWDLDATVRAMRSEYALMRGRFLGEGIHAYGAVMRLSADLDGDGNEEEIGFKFSHGGFSMWIRKFDKTLPLELPDWIQQDMHGVAPETIHIAIKDVTNDGLPEILLAAHDGRIDLKIAVYGFNSTESRTDLSLAAARFGLLQVLEHGQRVAYVLEGGTIRMPYGSASHVWNCKWDGERFLCTT